ncbi:MAG: DUF4163 domain-containing protein [Saprospiraceae bacterium]|nr:DUF4163 domain-containing protein [Saprospiraceae bacterium]
MATAPKLTWYIQSWWKVLEVQQAINDSIYGFLIQTLVFEGFKGKYSKENLKEAAQSFLNEWRTANNTEPDNSSNTGWEVSVTGEVGLHTPKVVSITMGSYSYAGGAHPNSFVSIFNFDLKTGKTLTWKDLFTDMHAWKNWWKRNSKKPESFQKMQTWSRRFLWGEHFQSPTNFELQEEGVYFWYNPFEAAAMHWPNRLYHLLQRLGETCKRRRISSPQNELSLQGRLSNHPFFLARMPANASFLNQVDWRWHTDGCSV